MLLLANITAELTILALCRLLNGLSDWGDIIYFELSRLHLLGSSSELWLEPVSELQEHIIRMHQLYLHKLQYFRSGVFLNGHLQESLTYLIIAL